ncbi:MAG TPA: aminoglycoside adenylyltransferase domain-containing protein [Streptosporangiaceae bacterium]|nr:aminoglycoside adenylyltransferase domain-containing protein [Streptosporangiaceae bacterium]
MAESPDGTAAGAPRSYAAAVTAELGALLDGALTAAYLHGSSVLGGWNAERSDVDILFVVTDDIGEQAVARAGEVLLQAAAGCPGWCLEASIVTASAAARPAPPWPFVLHVGCSDGEQVLHRGSDSPGDPDLLMHYAVCRASGLALAGPSPRATIGKVDRQAVLHYLAGELGWGLTNAPENYAVLNACRALVYLRQGRVVGKVAGGLAALDDGSGPAGVIRRALDQQQAMAPERTAAPDAVAFVRGVAAELRVAASAPSASPPA